jgi:hypothetical protein
MAQIAYIAAEDGIDTLRLQRDHPELFDVAEKDGVERWRLRADVRAALRAPAEKAGRKWIAARDRFYATGDDEDKSAAIEAALEYRAALMKLQIGCRGGRGRPMI